jgi:hypothetical protein
MIEQNVNVSGDANTAPQSQEMPANQLDSALLGSFPFRFFSKGSSKGLSKAERVWLARCDGRILAP